MFGSAMGIDDADLDMKQAPATDRLPHDYDGGRHSLIQKLRYSPTGQVIAIAPTPSKARFRVVEVFLRPV